MGNCKLYVISRTLNGKIFHCHTCNKIHIEYKNLNFNFSEDEFIFFKDYFLKLDPEKWEKINRDTCYCRKVMIPIGHKNFTAMFHAAEIYELKELFKKTRNRYNEDDLIKLKEIESGLNFN